MPAPPGTPAASLAAPSTAQVIGGGIAGVASKREQDGIKIYHDQKSIQKWEFVYDITKDPAKGGGAAQVPAPANPNGASNAPGSSTTATSTPSTTTSTDPNATTAAPTVNPTTGK
jgi:hypothetical protein